MIKTIDFFPETLKSLPVWMLWRLEPDANGRETKVPYSALYSGRGSSTNPSTWTTYDRAKAILEEHPDFYKGIALCISNGLIFVDIDHCVDEEGHFSEIASDILGRCEDQFVELSQSGTGLHILMKGTIPRNFKNSSNGVEMYFQKRFVAMTGCAIFANEPHEDQSTVDYIFGRYKTLKSEIKHRKMEISALPNDDRWIIEHASRRGRFDDLYHGRWSSMYGSQSEADLALCVILAFWCNYDPEQIDRIFRTSDLYREKWERDDYRRDTIHSAINHCDESFAEYLKERRVDNERAFLEMW